MANLSRFHSPWMLPLALFMVLVSILQQDQLGASAIRNYADDKDKPKPVYVDIKKIPTKYPKKAYYPSRRGENMLISTLDGEDIRSRGKINLISTLSRDKPPFRPYKPIYNYENGRKYRTGLIIKNETSTGNSRSSLTGDDDDFGIRGKDKKPAVKVTQELCDAPVVRRRKTGCRPLMRRGGVLARKLCRPRPKSAARRIDDDDDDDDSDGSRIEILYPWQNYNGNRWYHRWQLNPDPFNDASKYWQAESYDIYDPWANVG